MATVIQIMSDIDEEKIETDDIPEPDEIMEPQPVDTQTMLWKYLDVAVDFPALEREEKFIGLEPEIQQYLASQALAEQLGKIGTQFNFKPEDSTALAKTIHDLFIQEISLDAFDATLATALGRPLTTLGPIKMALKDVFSAFASYTEKNPQTVRAGQEPIKIPIGTSEMAPRPLDASPSAGASQAESMPETPFMLHIEKPDLGTLPQGVTPLSSNINYSERKQKPSSSEAKPVRVKIELPQGEPREKARSRVVHYSNLRTPLPEDKV